MSLRHTKHYFRAVFLIIGALFAFFIVRAFLLPGSFGEFGYYRGDNVAEQMAKPVRFAAREACADCHGDIWKTHQSGSHAPVQCQNCHDALAVHFDVEKGEFIGKMPIQRTSKLCLRCHDDLPSRPDGFPKIDLEDHLKDIPDAHKPEVCFQCHQPHSPKIGDQGPVTRDQ
ncbi:MAG: hypothetical protein HY541_01415 [Deltaproteobacteria bacterium]|nr:hypothetical protein [Deltaproteobacteria bacterium]